MGFIVGDDGPNGDGDGDGNGNGNGHGSRSDVGGAPATPSTTTEMNNDVENGHDKNSSPPPPTSTSTLRTKNSNMILSNAELIFENMTFIVGQGRGGSGDDNNEKAILKNVGAKVTSGHVLAIMGPSGAGKTTLISTLTKTANYGKAYGKVTLNGMDMSHSVFIKYCYTVTQQDNNWPYLTIRETLMYAAELYNVANDREDIILIVNEVIRKMGLVNVADTKSSQLSGGQQRRLSLAIGLLKQPTVLFLDEPTSGLDAASAAAIMAELTRLAKEEKLIIVCTIHQPSSKVYNDFDQVMILSRGREAYVGKASEAVNYFDSIGYPLPSYTNVAEHFLDVVNADFSSQEEVDTILNVWEEKKRQRQEEQEQQQRKSKTNRLSSRSSSSSLSRKEETNTFEKQEIDNDDNDEREEKESTIIRKNNLLVMLRRNFLITRRDTILYLGRFIGFFVVNCIFGLVYIKARYYTQKQAISKLWINAWYTGVPANMAVVAVYKLNLEFKSILSEVKNGISSPIEYILSKTILTFPIFFAFAISAMAVPAFIIQDFPIETFGYFILLWTSQIFVWESSSEVFAIIFNDVIIGMLIHTAWWFFCLLFSGYLVPEEDLYWPLKLGYFSTVTNYYIRAACYIHFTNHDWEPCTDPTSSAVCTNSTDGIDVLDGLERVFPVISTEDTYWFDMMMIWIIGIGWKVAAIAIIMYKAKQEPKIYKPIDVIR